MDDQCGTARLRLDDGQLKRAGPTAPNPRLEGGHSLGILFRMRPGRLDLDEDDSVSVIRVMFWMAV